MALIERYDAAGCDYCGEPPMLEFKPNGFYGQYRIVCDCGLCGPWEECEKDALFYWGCMKVDVRYINSVRGAEDKDDKIIQEERGGGDE